jgi:hypothetical protein
MQTRQTQNRDKEYTATGYLYPTTKLSQSVQKKKVIAHKMFDRVIILFFFWEAQQRRVYNIPISEEQ